MTIKEIAKRANVSLGTVDRVIHNRGKVAKKTEEKILKILKEVDYKPNIYARGLVLNKYFSIAALIPTFNEGAYWEVPRDGMAKAAKELSQFGIKIEFFCFDQHSRESFIEASNKMLEFKPDGVILAPVINFEATKLCAKLNKDNIPLVLIDSKLSSCDNLAFIGQDAYQGGRLAAKLLSSTISNKGKLLIVSIKNNENYNKTLGQRIEGFKHFFIQSNYLDDIVVDDVIVDQRDSDWEKLLESIIEEIAPDGIYVPSSKVHYVAKILSDTNATISLVGNDLVEDTVMYIKAEIIDYVIGQRPEKQGYMALEFLYKSLVLKQKVFTDIYLPLDIITKENLKYYRTNF